MLAGIAALLVMVFAAYLIFQTLNGRFPRLHVILYLLSALSGVYTLTYFLSMGISFVVKVAVSIVLGIVLILIATSLKRRRRAG